MHALAEIHGFMVENAGFGEVSIGAPLWQIGLYFEDFMSQSGSIERLYAKIRSAIRFG